MSQCPLSKCTVSCQIRVRSESDLRKLRQQAVSPVSYPHGTLGRRGHKHIAVSPGKTKKVAKMRVTYLPILFRDWRSEPCWFCSTPETLSVAIEHPRGAQGLPPSTRGWSPRISSGVVTHNTQSHHSCKQTISLHNRYHEGLWTIIIHDQCCVWT